MGTRVGHHAGEPAGRYVEGQIATAGSAATLTGDVASREAGLALLEGVRPRHSRFFHWIADVSESAQADLPGDLPSEATGGEPGFRGAWPLVDVNKSATGPQPELTQKTLG